MSTNSCGQVSSLLYLKVCGGPSDSFEPLSVMPESSHLFLCDSVRLHDCCPSFLSPLLWLQGLTCLTHTHGYTDCCYVSFTVYRKCEKINIINILRWSD